MENMDFGFAAGGAAVAAVSAAAGPAVLVAAAARGGGRLKPRVEGAEAKLVDDCAALGATAAAKSLLNASNCASSSSSLSGGAVVEKGNASRTDTSRQCSTPRPPQRAHPGAALVHPGAACQPSIHPARRPTYRLHPQRGERAYRWKQPPVQRSMGQA